MDLGGGSAQESRSFTMPNIPAMTYMGSIHESSKFRMFTSPHAALMSNGPGAGQLHPSSSPAAPAPARPPAPPPPSHPPEDLSHTRHSTVAPPPVPASTPHPEPVTASLPPSLASKKPVKYRECLKNHAATIGGLALDGCGEFMPSGEEGSLEALKCAACDCHRNFHRREVEGELNCSFCYSRGGMMKDQRRRFPPLAALPPHTTLALPPSPAVGPAGASPRSVSGQQPLLALHSSGSPSGDGGDHNYHVHRHQEPPHLMHMMQPHHHFHNSLGSSMKKRFRSKFSAEQKDRMFEFAEKLGWRIQKQDEAGVHQFCAEVGVKRHVFKVWMHNNKNTFGKKISPNEGGVVYLDNGGSSPTSSSGAMQH